MDLVETHKSFFKIQEPALSIENKVYLKDSQNKVMCISVEKDKNGSDNDNSKWKFTFEEFEKTLDETCIMSK